MSETIIILIIVLISEVFVAVIFAVIAQLFYKTIGFDFKAIFKGFMERFDFCSSRNRLCLSIYPFQ